MGQKSFAWVSMTFYEKFMTRNGSHTSQFSFVLILLYEGPMVERENIICNMPKKKPIEKFYEILMNNN